MTTKKPNQVGLLFNTKFLDLHIRDFADSDLSVMLLSVKKEITRRKSAATRARRAAQRERRAAAALCAYEMFNSSRSPLTSAKEIKKYIFDEYVSKQHGMLLGDVDDIIDFDAIFVNGSDEIDPRNFNKTHLKNKNSFKFLFLNDDEKRALYDNDAYYFKHSSDLENTLIVLNEKYLYTAFINAKSSSLMFTKRHAKHVYYADFFCASFLTKLKNHK